MTGSGRRSEGGEERAEPPVVHPWEFDRAPVRAFPGRPRVVHEYHLDGRGVKRLFRLTESHGPAGARLEAEEVREGEPTGWSFSMRFDPEMEPPPYRALRERLTERLAVRDVVTDPDTGRPEILDRLVRGRIVAPADPDAAGPDLLIDGDRVTWEALGRALVPYAGHGLRAEVVEGGEE